MLLDRLRYEVRITGWWAFLTPAILLLCLLPMALVFVNLHVTSLRISQVLTASLEMLLPVAAGLLVANQVGHDAALELHLTFPSPYRSTMVLRTALIVLWIAVLAFFSSSFLYHLKYLRIPVQFSSMQVVPQFLTWQLTWLAPLCWFVALGACCALLLRSRTASSALLGGIWTLEAIFYGYFALLNPRTCHLVLAGESPGPARHGAGVVCTRLVVIAQSGVALARRGRRGVIEKELKGNQISCRS